MDIFFKLALEDIRDACDVLRPAWEASGGDDGFVSMEVDPRLAYDSVGTFEQAMWIHKEVDRPNLMVKIPATQLGLSAIEDSIARGKSINITLIFSLERYRAVVEAYLRGLERLVAAGGDPSKVASVASFFVSRVDTEADKRLDALGSGGARGQAGDREREARVRALRALVLGAAVGLPRRQGRPRPALPVGLDVDEESGVPRRALRRGADRPGDGEHDAARDDRGVPGSRRGAGRHGQGGSRRGAAAARRSGRGGGRLRRCHRHGGGRGGREVRRLVDRDHRRHRRQALKPRA